jgi:preprotein translocase subunit SecY
MFSWLVNAWKVRELRKRVLFTAAILALYRLGSWMPAPGVDSNQIKEAFQGQGGGTVLNLLNMFSGGALSKFSLFALGIMPYITASIIMQLMTAAVPQLEQIQKEGESGQAKITQYTRYFTVVLSAIQAIGWTFLFHRQGYLPGTAPRFMLIILTLTAGSMLLMWLGELITKRGVGNGISLLVFASIITGLPGGLQIWINGTSSERLFFPLLVLAVIVAVVFVQEGQRKIPIQYAKRVVGRRMTSGGSTYMPLRVNMAGVIPVIFAAALMSFPPTIALFFPNTQNFINRHFQATGNLFLSMEALLIIGFTFFYTAVQFNPVDQADNLRKNGGYVPGIRPGPPTAQYFDRVMTRLTFPGSLFLATVAVFPGLAIKYFHFSQTSSSALGGTSILIVVGVALDTMRQMESQMMARSYEGFLK